MAYRDLDPEAAQEAIGAEPDLQLLDVRTEPEHRRYRLPSSKLVPIQELQQRLDELDPAANWLVYCEHGRRSVVVCEFLHRAGFSRLANLRGGMAHWLGRGLPAETG